ncbi:Uncharacterised protein [Mycobacteroides abscessus]|nr:Uncharacterised protein [Mycobacteroides abscessus]
MPDAATEPNRTTPAPPRTGVGTAATTRPRTGSRPRITRIAPPAPTTNRDFTPVMATRPTFCANADCVKDPKNGDTMDDAMSARRPSAMRLRFTLVPTISPTAMMSAVVSVRVTRMTMSMEMIAAISNVGAPKPRNDGNAATGPSPTPEKSALPSARAMSVPTTIAMRIDRREIVPLPTLDSRMTIANVSAARPMLLTEP